MSAWSSLNRKVNDLMSTCIQPTEELPQAFVQIATSQQTMSWPLQKAPAMQGMVKSKPGREADEWTQSYAGFQRWHCTSFCPLLKRSQRCHWDLSSRYCRALATTQQPLWSLLEGGWPSGGQLWCLWAALHQPLQLALPFTQINSDNTVLLK